MSSEELAEETIKSIRHALNDLQYQTFKCHLVMAFERLKSKPVSDEDLRDRAFILSKSIFNENGVVKLIRQDMAEALYSAGFKKGWRACEKHMADMI